MADQESSENAPPRDGEPRKKTEPPAGAAAPKPAAKAQQKPQQMEAIPWEGPLVDRLRERFGERIREFSAYREQNFLIAGLDAVPELIEHLKLEEDFDFLTDITAVDYPERDKRFELIWHLYSFAKNVRVRVKADAAEGEKATSVVSTHKGANWLEREVFDMFGIEFEGHPDLKRILLPDEWQGYPLRRDYSIIQQDETWVKENLHIDSAQ